MKTFLSLALVAAAGRIFAQSGGAPPIRVDVDLVNVLCTVSDKHGALVTDLTKDDFEIREDGKKQEIRYFSRETDLPLTVAMLVDVSGSVHEVLADEREAAGRFFDTVLRPTDHALLLGFSSTLVLWQNFTSSTQRLKSALERLHAMPFHGLPPLGQPMPGTLLYDAVYATARGKLAGVPGRKAMLIVSDGLDNGSQKHLDDAIEAVQATNTIVYGICYEGKFSGCSFLKELAEPTGGRMFEAGKKRTLDEIFGVIESELRSQYSISFVPLNGARDGKFRKLHVRVLTPGLRVSARRGYYALGGEERGGEKK
ncbi:MAG TPA: VWA domain-containing protein [Bryobacteraceae bacterium]|nr:VWA domain-containing protein [Bryobacteraceae bacterium]